MAQAGRAASRSCLINNNILQSCLMELLFLDLIARAEANSDNLDPPSHVQVVILQVSYVLTTAMYLFAFMFLAFNFWRIMVKQCKVVIIPLTMFYVNAAMILVCRSVANVCCFHYLQREQPEQSRYIHISARNKTIADFSAIQMGIFQVASMLELYFILGQMQAAGKENREHVEQPSIIGIVTTQIISTILSIAVFASMVYVLVAIKNIEEIHKIIAMMFAGLGACLTGFACCLFFRMNRIRRSHQSMLSTEFTFLRNFYLVYITGCITHILLLMYDCDIQSFFLVEMLYAWLPLLWDFTPVLMQLVFHFENFKPHQARLILRTKISSEDNVMEVDSQVELCYIQDGISGFFQQEQVVLASETGSLSQEAGFFHRAPTPKDVSSRSMSIANSKFLRALGLPTTGSLEFGFNETNSLGLQLSASQRLAPREAHRSNLVRRQASDVAKVYASVVLYKTGSFSEKGELQATRNSHDVTPTREEKFATLINTVQSHEADHQHESAQHHLSTSIQNYPLVETVEEEDILEEAKQHGSGQGDSAISMVIPRDDSSVSTFNTKTTENEPASQAGTDPAGQASRELISEMSMRKQLIYLRISGQWNQYLLNKQIAVDCSKENQIDFGPVGQSSYQHFSQKVSRMNSTLKPSREHKSAEPSMQL